MTMSPSPFEPGNPYYRPPEPVAEAPPQPHPEDKGQDWRVPWTVRDAAWGLLVPIFFYALTFLARRILGEATPGTAAPPPSGSGARLLAGFLVIVFQSALLIPAWWVLRKYKVGVRSLGLRSYDVLPGCGLTFTLLILGYICTAAWGLFVQQFGMRPQPNPLPLFGEGIPGLILALITAGLVAPFTEEVFFRGFLFGALRTRYGAAIGIFLSAFIFAAAHLQPLAFPALFALGAILAWLYVLTGSLWPGIMMHATINTVALLALYIINPT